MKKIFLSFVALTLISVFAIAQKISADKVPAAVKSAFKTKFPGATKADWEMEKTEFEANFKLNGQETSANFDAAGKWIETEVEIKTSELPAEVKAAIISKYEEYKINEASKIDHVIHGKCFEAEIEKGEETLDVLFTPDGKFISQTVDEEDKDRKKD